MENKNTVTEIDLLDLLRYLFVPKRICIAMAAAVLAVALLAIYNHVTYVPEYKAKSTLYILKQDAEKTLASSSDFSTALNVVNDCAYILKMESVLGEVIEELNLDTSYSALKGKISVNNPNETRVLEVTARALSPDLAVRIADSVCRIGTQKINESVGFMQVHVTEEAQRDSAPCNKPGLKSYVLAGLLVAVVVYAVYFVLYMLDDGIHSDEDVQRYLGLSVLGRIPALEAISRQSRYEYGGYGRSGTRKKRKQTH